MTSHSLWQFRRGMLWSAELTDPPRRGVKARIPVEYRQITPETLPDLIAAACQIDPVGRDALTRRIESGRECYAVWVGGCVASYGWLTRGPEWVGEFERELCVQPGEAYLWDCATLPEYRQHRLFSGLLTHVIDHLRWQGLERLWIIGLVSPAPLLDGVTAAGFDPLLRFDYLRLHHARILATRPLPAASPERIAAARRLLTPPGDSALGPLIAGIASRLTPPDTHYDG
jgi:hypothetical protein